MNPNVSANISVICAVMHSGSSCQIKMLKFTTDSLSVLITLDSNSQLCFHTQDIIEKRIHRRQCGLKLLGNDSDVSDDVCAV